MGEYRKRAELPRKRLLPKCLNCFFVFEICIIKLSSIKMLINLGQSLKMPLGEDRDVIICLLNIQGQKGSSSKHLINVSFLFLLTFKKTQVN